MARLLGLTLAATMACTVAAHAAPERIRGTIESFDNDTLTVKSRQGGEVKLALGDATKYASVEKSSLSDVAQGRFVGIATKQAGNTPVALEVVVFPESMRGAGEGHYPWDRMADSSGSGQSVASSMTNGSVTAARARQVNTQMTNGNVEAESGQSGGKRLTVSYKGGEQKIVVPPNVPVVTLEPGDRAILRDGANVFVRATEDNGKATADFVAVGKGDVVPPM
ncbi:MAG: hypothetical protein JOY65_03230 [Acetobacteraceae bacterium]|nr:hypothetical protein [Acetobacteraceae bacterium]